MGRPRDVNLYHLAKDRRQATAPSPRRRRSAFVSPVLNTLQGNGGRDITRKYRRLCTKVGITQHHDESLQW
eukprot:2739758-Pyramimonas_sp.AAC.1